MIVRDGISPDTCWVRCVKKEDTTREGIPAVMTTSRASSSALFRTCVLETEGCFQGVRPSLRAPKESSISTHFVC